LNQLAIVLETFGMGYGYLGQFTLAEAALQESMDIRYEIDQRNNIVINHYLLALVQLHQGKYPQAKAFAQKSLQLANELNDVSSNGNGYTVLGATALVDGSYDESRSHYKHGIAAYRTGWQQDWQSRQGFAYAQLAILDCRQGYLEQARRHLQMALQKDSVDAILYRIMFYFPGSQFIPGGARAVRASTGDLCPGDERAAPQTLSLVQSCCRPGGRRGS
jgi:tetratricopeptide (TPR) repeat protein